MTVWKFALQLADLQSISMPSGAKILHVADQHGVVCMWALVDPSADRVTRTFTVIGTGHIAPSSGEYIGSALAHGGALTWHVFEEVPF